MSRMISGVLILMGTLLISCKEDMSPERAPEEMSSVCISSYEDLISLLDTNTLTVESIQLENGITITPPSADVGNITYTAINRKTGSSIFNSFLEVKWRQTPEDPWQGFTSDVWTKGCSGPNIGPVVYTNLLVGNTLIIINTSLSWNIGEYAGHNIRYLVINPI